MHFITRNSSFILFRFSLFGFFFALFFFARYLGRTRPLDLRCDVKSANCTSGRHRASWMECCVVKQGCGMLRENLTAMACSSVPRLKSSSRLKRLSSSAAACFPCPSRETNTRMLTCVMRLVTAWVTLAFDSLHHLRSETATLHNNAQLLVALRASSSQTTPLFSEVSMLALLRGFSGGREGCEWVEGWKWGRLVVDDFLGRGVMWGSFLFLFVCTLGSIQRLCTESKLILERKKIPYQ